MASNLALLRERYAVMKAHGVPTEVRQVSHTSAIRFDRAMRDAGADPDLFPHLLNTSKSYRSEYSPDPFAIMRRENRAKLKEGGMEPARLDHWSRNEAATQFALRAIAAGRLDELPARPGLMHAKTVAARRELESRPTQPRKPSTSPRANATRARYGKLRDAGLDVARSNRWCRGQAAFQYALAFCSSGRVAELPHTPGMVRTAIKDGAMALIAVLLLCINGWGCGWPNDPPAYYAIDSEFPEEQRETIRAAYDAWCEAEGYCPQEAIWADRGRVMLIDDLPENEYTEKHCPPGRECTTSGHNTGGDNVVVARNRARGDDLGALWVVVAHEIGHYCTEHTKTGLMAAAQDEPILEIDQVAIRAWERGCY